MDMKLTRHAIERYQERVKPTLATPVCGRELAALVEDAPFQTEPPWRVWPADVEREPPEPPVGYVELAPRIWGVVAEDRRGRRFLVTILIDGCMCSERRRERNEARQNKRAARRRKTREYVFLNGERRSRIERWA